MSKNFELMQEVIAMEQEGIPPSANGRAVPFADREYVRRSSRMALDQVTREESLKLAQRVFLAKLRRVRMSLSLQGLIPEMDAVASVARPLVRWQRAFPDDLSGRCEPASSVAAGGISVF